MDNALLEALNPEHERWQRQNFRSARTIDIVCRKDGREYRYEGDFLKDVARVLVPTTPGEVEFARIASEVNAPLPSIMQKRKEG
jgi:hypothetical protein